MGFGWPRARRSGPLRVLFVGTLQLRKGIPYLLAARRQLRGNGVRIRLVGPSLLAPSVMRELRREMEVVGPVPRSRIGEHYAWADVVVLPTLSEGSANVVYEAMAAGLPVITTANAGSIIVDGESGVLIPIRDTEALAAVLERFAEGYMLKPGPGRSNERGLRDERSDSYATRLVAAMDL